MCPSDDAQLNEADPDQGPYDAESDNEDMGFIIPDQTVAPKLIWARSKPMQVSSL